MFFDAAVCVRDCAGCADRVRVMRLVFREELGELEAIMLRGST